MGDKMKVGDKVWYKTAYYQSASSHYNCMWTGIVTQVTDDRVEFVASEEDSEHRIGIVNRPRKFVFLNPYDARNCIR